MSTWLCESELGLLMKRNSSSNFNYQSKLYHIQQHRFMLRSFEDIKNANMVRFMPSGACESRRYYLKNDKLGFSFHWTVLYPNKSMYIHYKNHIEAVMCIDGDCTVEIVNDKSEKGNGIKYQIKKGDCYALDKNDKHYLYGGTNDCHLVCVFNPACIGTEEQNEDGIFPLIDENGKKTY